VVSDVISSGLSVIGDADVSTNGGLVIVAAHQLLKHDLT
jgi:hypothetical protein